MRLPVARTIQRYFVPGFISSIYFFLRYRAIVSLKSRVQLTGRIRLGKGTVVKPFAIIQVSAGKGVISIGKNCAISSFNHISTAEGDLVIGDNVRLGSNVVLMGVHRTVKKKDVLIVDQGYTHRGLKIGDDAMIGAGSVVLGGSDIGQGAVIGAGSVVTKPVPPYSVVGGMPVKTIGERK